MQHIGLLLHARMLRYAAFMLRWCCVERSTDAAFHGFEQPLHTAAYRCAAALRNAAPVLRH
jgi:hypothetical protein